MDTATNTLTVHRLLDAINDGALQALPDVVAAGVVDHNAVIFMQPDGPGGVAKGVAMLLEGFPDLHITVDDTVAERDTVVVRLTMTGTNTGPYRGLPEPTQRTFVAEAIAMFRLEGGKIHEIRGVADRLAMLTQLGLLPDLG